MHKIVEVDLLICKFILSKFLIQKIRYTSHNDETYLSLCHFIGKQDSPSTADKDCKKSIGDIEGAVEKGANRKGGATDPNFLSLAVPRLSVCADAQKVDRAKLAQTEVTLRI